MIPDLMFDEIGTNIKLSRELIHVVCGYDVAHLSAESLGRSKKFGRKRTRCALIPSVRSCYESWTHRLGGAWQEV